MLSTEILTDAFGRIHAVVHSVLKDAPVELLTFRPGPEANTIAWLVWHLTRVQDAQIADLMGAEQVWTAASWVERFDLPFDAAATGYGQSTHDVGEVRTGASLLVGYFDAVHERTIAFLGTLTEEDLARTVDAAWNPPVTLLVRVVSTFSDDLQHAGQASYVRGLAERAGISAAT
jgi:uncharacterized damage-inducible protein DinB